MGSTGEPAIDKTERTDLLLFDPVRALCLGLLGLLGLLDPLSQHLEPLHTLLPRQEQAAAQVGEASDLVTGLEDRASACLARFAVDLCRNLVPPLAAQPQQHANNQREDKTETEAGQELTWRSFPGVRARTGRSAAQSQTPPAARGSYQSRHTINASANEGSAGMRGGMQRTKCRRVRQA